MHLLDWPGLSSALPANLPTIRLGYIDYLNCLPVYYGLEQGQVRLPVAVRKGAPAELNAAFVRRELDITPISSIEYARHAADCLILPDLSISADGRVGSIFLIGRRPPEALGGQPVALTSASATSVVLLRAILELGLGVRPDYHKAAPQLETMLAAAESALLIGDDAILAAHRLGYPFTGTGTTWRSPEGFYVTDLGLAWQQLTGQVMVFALWVLHREYAEEHPDAVAAVGQLFRESQAYGWAHRPQLLAEAARRRQLPRPVLEDYFTLIRHELSPRYRTGLLDFFEYAQRLGEVETVPQIAVWGDA